MKVGALSAALLALLCGCSQDSAGGPSDAAVAAVAANPCFLFTPEEMGSLIDARIVEKQSDAQPPRQLCSYHGDVESAGTIVELGFVPPEELRRVRGRRVGPSDFIAEIAAGQQTDPVPGLADEALYIATGSGQLWLRDGNLVLSVTVVRNATEGDREAAVELAKLVLGRLSTRS